MGITFLLQFKRRITTFGALLTSSRRIMWAYQNMHFYMNTQYFGEKIIFDGIHSPISQASSAIVNYTCSIISEILSWQRIVFGGRRSIYPDSRKEITCNCCLLNRTNPLQSLAKNKGLFPPRSLSPTGYHTLMVF